MKYYTSLGLAFDLLPMMPEDFDDIHQMLQDPLMDFHDSLVLPSPIEETQFHFMMWTSAHPLMEADKYSFTIRNESKKLLGIAGIKNSGIYQKNWEIWYKIIPEYRNKGLATATIKALCEKGFEFTDTIYAHCITDNIGSIKALINNKFEYTSVKLDVYNTKQNALEAIQLRLDKNKFFKV